MKQSSIHSLYCYSTCWMTVRDKSVHCLFSHMNSRHQQLSGTFRAHVQVFDESANTCLVCGCCDNISSTEEKPVDRSHLWTTEKLKTELFIIYLCPHSLYCMNLPVMSISDGLEISMQKPGAPQRISLRMWDTQTQTFKIWAWWWGHLNDLSLVFIFLCLHLYQVQWLHPVDLLLQFNYTCKLQKDEFLHNIIIKPQI